VFQQKTEEVELKSCTRCEVKKHFGEFYEKEKDLQGRTLRYDAICKDCRRSERLARYRGQGDSTQPKVLIEPSSNVETEPKRLIEPEKIDEKQQNDPIDYSLWERLYGRTLTELEKLEIKTNLSDFFTTLIEEGQRQRLPIFSAYGKGTGL